MNYFVLVYDQSEQRLESLERYDAEADAALARRFELELEHRADPQIEVVVLSAETEDDLVKTHGRYFKSVGELTSYREPAAAL